MDAILSVLPIVVVLVLIWLTYLNISFAVTVFRTKKKDATLTSCLHTKGKYFYMILSCIYVVSLIGCIVVMVLLLIDKEDTIIYYVLNGITIFSILVSYLLQQIIWVGHRQLLIGRILLDYRKIKRVTFPSDTKLHFVYGQKKYQTSLRWIDEFKLKKALQKAR